METTDIHNCHRRFEREKENLAQFNNGKIAMVFLRQWSHGISVPRVSTLAWNVRTILVWKDDKPLTSWAKQDIDFIVNQMQKKDWSSDTRERFAFTLKRFLAFVVTKKIIDEIIYRKLNVMMYEKHWNSIHNR